MKNQKIYLGILIAFILLVGIYFALPYFKLVQGTVFGGTTNLAISNVELVGTGQQIRVYGVAGTGAENLNINFRADEITSYIQSKGYKATKDIIGSIQLTKQVKKFLITKETDNNFLRLYALNVGRLSTEQTCKDRTPAGYKYLQNFRSPTLVNVCLYDKVEGTNGIFNGQTIEDSEISFNIGGSTGILKPSQGFNTLTLNDGQTKVEYTGSLNNYNTISAPNYDVLFKDSQFNRLISPSAFAQYKIEADKFGVCIGSEQNSYYNLLKLGLPLGVLSLPSVDSINTCVNTFNNRLDNFLIDRTSEYSTSINANSVTYSANSMDVNLKTASNFPTFIITLDATKVGIIELKGDPKIISCVPETIINSGDTKATSIKVQNVGEADGSFSGSISCSGGNVNGYISEVLVGKGTIADLPVQLSGSKSTSGIDYNSCQFTITDRKSGKSVTCTSQIGVKYQGGIRCEAFTEKCTDANNLRICNADGTDYTDETCDLGCRNNQCVANTCTKDSDCKTDEVCNVGLCESKIDPKKLICEQDSQTFLGQLQGLKWQPVEKDCSYYNKDNTLSGLANVGKCQLGGLVKPTVNECVPTLLWFWIVLLAIIIMGIITIIVLLQKKKRRNKK